MKSPKAGKGKKSTTWDPVLYGGKVNKEEVSMEILYFQSPVHKNKIQVQIQIQTEIHIQIQILLQLLIQIQIKV